MSAKKRMGERTVLFPSAPAILSGGNIVTDTENDGPLCGRFDQVVSDDTLGEESWERAERVMFEEAVKTALYKAETELGELQCLLGGDLLNQLISANYAARELGVPFLGMYSACSTISQSLLTAGMMIDGGYVENAVCAASSHFSTAERQFRFPLEMGTTSTPTAQHTVTGAGALFLTAGQAKKNSPRVVMTSGTIGKVIDYGIRDMSNMGAAMAPAAADTILAHLKDTGRTIEYYDKVITGDLGTFGSEMLRELCAQKAVDLTGRHQDCGMIIYGTEKNMVCGGSGAGCSAVVLSAHILEQLKSGNWKRVLFLATGALMSPVSSKQGETMPSIAHAVVLEEIE
ncbi:stage V sporulation protein AD [Christensenellaceae bacterium OttesenSCG-928-M15]|nr:stage V sporulation protein AD [Christensenellaceae bacterium OttesenSCG-928-M15]